MSGPLSLKALIGEGYDDYWRTRKFFRVCKGAKGSKKSKTTALWYIYHIMKYYPYANLLVIRRYFSDIRDSCYTDLLWAIDKLEVTHLWKATNVPLEIMYCPQGVNGPSTKIMFRGLDDASKIASITVRTGILCWMWIEEAYQITDEMEFEKLQMSLRGLIPEGSGLFKQITLTFNPWSEHTWLKPRFFDNPGDNVFSKTTTYKCNEWLGPEDIARYEELRIRNPKRARIVCDGDWGVSEGLIYENWEEKPFDIKEILSQPNIKTTFGLDFGYSISYNAFVAIAVDMENRVMWIWDEMYNKQMTNIDIAKKIIEMGYGKEHIIADCQEIKSITELQRGFDVSYDVGNGMSVRDHISLPNIQRALKGNDSVSNGIQRIQSFKIFVHPKCVNVITEFNNYAYDVDSEGKQTDKPIKDFDHAMDAMRYAMEKFFVRGRGRVVEAKGVDEKKDLYATQRDKDARPKRRRVFSTR